MSTNPVCTSGSSHSGAAVYIDRLSGDITRFLGGQKHYQVTDVFRRLFSPQRSVGLYPGIEQLAGCLAGMGWILFDHQGSQTVPE